MGFRLAERPAPERHRDTLCIVMERDPLAPWRLLDEHVVLKTPWFEIAEQHLEISDGVTPTYYVHRTLDSVMCVCVTADREVLVERQYRPPIGKVSIDYPAGRLEEGDGGADAAVLRELAEETGFRPTTIERIAVIDRDPGFSSTRTHVYLAQGMVPGAHRPDTTERIVWQFVPARDVLSMVISGEMNCAFCVSATFYAFRKLGWLQLHV